MIGTLVAETTPLRVNASPPTKASAQKLIDRRVGGVTDDVRPKAERRHFPDTRDFEHG